MEGKISAGAVKRRMLKKRQRKEKHDNVSEKQQMGKMACSGGSFLRGRMYASLHASYRTGMDWIHKQYLFCFSVLFSILYS